MSTIRHGFDAVHLQMRQRPRRSSALFWLASIHPWMSVSPLFFPQFQADDVDF
jgi:hypothetical protein